MVGVNTAGPGERIDVGGDVDSCQRGALWIMTEARGPGLGELLGAGGVADRQRSALPGHRHDIGREPSPAVTDETRMRTGGVGWAVRHGSLADGAAGCTGRCRNGQPVGQPAEHQQPHRPDQHRLRYSASRRRRATATLPDRLRPADEPGGSGSSRRTPMRHRSAGVSDAVDRRCLATATPVLRPA